MGHVRLRGSGSHQCPHKRHTNPWNLPESIQIGLAMVLGINYGRAVSVHCLVRRLLDILQPRKGR